MVTIRDIAKESGVSLTTVSLVLNGGPPSERISEKTKVRILEIARRMGYHPNLYARSLRSSRSDTFGVVIFDIADPYCAQIVRGIESHLRESGYFPILTDLQNDRAQFPQSLAMLLGRRVEGIIAIANPLYLETDLFTEFSRRNIPAVVIGRELKKSGISSVSTDNEAGTRQAIEHLYEIGHSKIAILKGPSTLADSMQRFRGVEVFAEQVGLRLDPSLILELTGRNSTYAEGYQLTQELLKKKADFTALIAFDDLTACAAIGALSKAGKVVPKDCSVVGFDDIPGSAYYNPPLTTVQQQLETQGSLGAEILEELVRAKAEKRRSVPKHRIVAPKLVIRDSTCPAPR